MCGVGMIVEFVGRFESLRQKTDQHTICKLRCVIDFTVDAGQGTLRTPTASIGLARAYRITILVSGESTFRPALGLFDLGASFDQNVFDSFHRAILLIYRIVKI